MDREEILKGEQISFSDDVIKVDKKTINFNDVESIYIGEQNLSKDKAFAYIAIGVVLIIFTSRWFMAGGVLAILAGIVTFFDSRRKYSVILKTKQGDTTVSASYDIKKIKSIEKVIKETVLT